MALLSDVLGYFDAIYVINLDSRPDKLESFNQGLLSAGLPQEFIDSRIKRFPGIISPQKIGYEGCLLSHIQILREARDQKLNKVLIFEDDAEFIGSIEDLEKSIDQAKFFNWDVFYLGYNAVHQINQISQNLVSLIHTYTTHAIAYHSRFFDHAITAMDQGRIKIIDVWLAKEIQYKFNCIGSYPMAFAQRPGFSDVENRKVNYDFIIERSMKNVKRLANG